MKRVLAYCLLLTALTSCIREDVPPCPRLRVDIAVRDKNYFNVNKVELEERLAEDLPLAAYVPTLTWRLSRLEPDGTLTPVEERDLFTVEGEEETHSRAPCWICTSTTPPLACRPSFRPTTWPSPCGATN